ncbi:MAG: site-2 protease family protein [Anaerolineaceae bacterium]|nr:site-2 protease family protein [Anaerolineaceae bacterium]
MIAFTVHEFAHAFVADSFGDTTPRQHGRLTLNPAAHLDLMGSLMLLFAGFGWAKPVPVNPHALQRRSRSAMMWVSFAGPASNLLLAFLAAIPLRFGLIPFIAKWPAMFPSPSKFLFDFLTINILLALFNLIPISPLDGEKILSYFLPSSWARTLEQIQPYGPMILMILIFAGPLVGIDILSWILYPAMSALTSLLLGVPL